MTNNLKPTWRSAPRFARTQHEHSQPLADSDIHVWCASLKLPPQDLDELFQLLSSDEKTRAERFYFERDRNRFIAGRGLLRTIISRYLEMEASQMEFVYGDHGKPALKLAPQNKAFEFNLSHSKDLALYIFNWNRKIGIDVEYVHPRPDVDDFARQFFSPRESAFVNALSGKQKEDAFFKIWTCKEAFLKANGNGLTLPINQVEISLEAEGLVMLKSIGGNKAQVTHWHLEIFNPVPGYQAALAVKGHVGQIVLQQLNNHLPYD